MSVLSDVVEYWMGSKMKELVRAGSGWCWRLGRCAIVVYGLM